MDGAERRGRVLRCRATRAASRDVTDDQIRTVAPLRNPATSASTPGTATRCGATTDEQEHG
jgi:hypothetical protein